MKKWKIKRVRVPIDPDNCTRYEYRWFAQCTARKVGRVCRCMTFAIDQWEMAVAYAQNNGRPF